MTPRFLASALVLMLLSGVVACTGSTPQSANASKGAGGSTTEQQVAQFTDIPVPTNSHLDLTRTLVLGGRDDWNGRAVFETSWTVNEMYEFYRKEMASFGWAEISAVRAETSMLVFSRTSRIATVMIAPHGNPFSNLTSAGSVVNMLVTPSSGVGGTGAGAGSSVQSRPLR
ncbi:MAG: hypothetical protein FJX47_00920 [Alphaproteobacteria bacterium]|nr:hypothetical protein [Alphaproteobacteria bacterium]